MRAGGDAGRLATMSRTYAELPGLMTLMTGDEKHGPSATSTLDVLWVLYDQVLRVSPDTVDDPGRDRFLLSKGNGPAAYYAVLAAKGFIPESWLTDFGSAGSRLGTIPRWLRRSSSLRPTRPRPGGHIRRRRMWRSWIACPGSR